MNKAEIIVNNDVLTASEAAMYLRISKPTLYKLIKEGKIKFNRIGKNYRFLKSELDNFLKIGVPTKYGEG